MCVTPAGKIGNCTWGMPEILATFGQKKAAFFTLFHQSKTVSSQFLLLPICRQEGIWSFEAAEERGVQVVHTGYTSAPTIELTWALILGSARNLVAENASLRS